MISVLINAVSRFGSCFGHTWHAMRWGSFTLPRRDTDVTKCCVIISHRLVTYCNNYNLQRRQNIIEHNFNNALKMARYCRLFSIQNFNHSAAFDCRDRGCSRRFYEKRQKEQKIERDLENNVVAIIATDKACSPFTVIMSKKPFLIAMTLIHKLQDIFTFALASAILCCFNSFRSNYG